MVAKKAPIKQEEEEFFEENESEPEPEEEGEEGDESEPEEEGEEEEEGEDEDEDAGSEAGDDEWDDFSGSRPKPWKSGIDKTSGVSEVMKGIDELWPFITHMKLADGDGKNDKGLSNKNVLSIIGRLFGKTYHQFLDEVEELSPETNDDILTVTEVKKFMRHNKKQLFFYEVEKEEFKFDEWVEESEEETLGVLYMREDNTGSCVTWVKDKGFLDYNKTRNPKPNDKDGETEIKEMIELLFRIEDDDWEDDPGSEAEKGKKVKKGVKKSGAVSAVKKTGAGKTGEVQPKKAGTGAGKKGVVLPKKKAGAGTKKKAPVEDEEEE